MALSQGPATPGRKARRSWFDAPPLTHLDPQPVSGQQVSKRRSLDVVETLTLTHFTNPPRITFGKAIIGKTKHRTLLLRNPHDFEQEVIVERFPYKKKFLVNQTRYMLLLYIFNEPYFFYTPFCIILAEVVILLLFFFL